MFIGELCSVIVMMLVEMLLNSVMWLCCGMVSRFLKRKMCGWIFLVVFLLSDFSVLRSCLICFFFSLFISLVILIVLVVFFFVFMVCISLIMWFLMILVVFGLICLRLIVWLMMLVWCFLLSFISIFVLKFEGIIERIQVVVCVCFFFRKFVMKSGLVLLSCFQMEVVLRFWNVVW